MPNVLENLFTICQIKVQTFLNNQDLVRWPRTLTILDAHTKNKRITKGHNKANNNNIASMKVSCYQYFGV